MGQTRPFREVVANVRFGRKADILELSGRQWAGDRETTDPGSSELVRHRCAESVIRINKEPTKSDEGFRTGAAPGFGAMGDGLGQQP